MGPGTPPPPPWEATAGLASACTRHTGASTGLGVTNGHWLVCCHLGTSEAGWWGTEPWICREHWGSAPEQLPPRSASEPSPRTRAALSSGGEQYRPPGTQVRTARGRHGRSTSHSLMGTSASAVLGADRPLTASPLKGRRCARPSAPQLVCVSTTSGDNLRAAAGGRSFTETPDIADGPSGGARGRERHAAGRRGGSPRIMSGKGQSGVCSELFAQKDKKEIAGGQRAGPALPHSRGCRKQASPPHFPACARPESSTRHAKPREAVPQSHQVPAPALPPLAEGDGFRLAVLQGGHQAESRDSARGTAGVGGLQASPGRGAALLRGGFKTRLIVCHCLCVQELLRLRLSPGDIQHAGIRGSRA